MPTAYVWPTAVAAPVVAAAVEVQLLRWLIARAAAAAVEAPVPTAYLRPTAMATPICLEARGPAAPQEPETVTEEPESMTEEPESVRGGEPGAAKRSTKAVTENRRTARNNPELGGCTGVVLNLRKSPPNLKKHVVSVFFI